MVDYVDEDEENEESVIKVTGKYKDFQLDEEKLSGIMIGTLTKIILDKNTPEIFVKELSTCAVADLKLNMIIESDSINFLRKGNLERFQQ